MSTNTNNAGADFNTVGRDNNDASAKVLSFPFKHPTNSEFLRALFGADAGRAWVADVHDGKKADWFGRRADACDVDAPQFMSGDTYFAVGVLKEGAPARGIAHWSHTPIIVVDDVGEKCSAEAVRAALGEPSYVLRTSFGSCQMGYILTKPLREAGIQARIMRALTLAFYGGTDPGHGDNVRYVRLPRGFNSKPKRVAENAGKPQSVMLLEWHPERRIDVLDLMMALDDLPGLTGGTAWSEAEGASVTHRITPAGLPNTLEEARARYLPRDYIFAAFDKLDRVVGMQGSQGYIEVRCPFNGHPDYGVHTNDDDRTGWNPELFLDGRTAFQCFHSDGGADRSNRGIEAVLRAELDARDGAGSFDALKHEGIKATFPPLPDTDRDSPEDSQPAEKPARARRLVPLGRNAPTTPLLARPSICSFMARGEVTTVAGQPSAGKSAFILSAALAIAADRPDIVGEKAFERTGDVLIVSKEDNLDAVRRRRAGWLKTHDIDVNRLKHEPHFVDDPDFTAAACVGNGSRVELTPDMAWLGEQIAMLRAERRDVCAVVLDTFLAVLDGLPENDNGTMGRVMALLSTWAARHNVAVVVPHHMPKANGRDGGAGELASIRGASAIGGGVRVAVTLTELDDKLKAKLPPAMRDNVVVLKGAKANHDAKAPTRYFVKETPPIDVVHEDGRTVPGRTVVMVPFKPNFGWDANSDNAKVAVLHVIADAERPTAENPAGQPLRVKTHGDIKGAADLIAEQEEAERSDVEKTVKALEDEALLERAQGPRSKAGHRPTVWRVTTAGRAWLEMKRVVLTTVGDEEAEAVVKRYDDPAERLSEIEAEGGTLAGLEEINFE